MMNIQRSLLVCGSMLMCGLPSISTAASRSTTLSLPESDNYSIRTFAFSPNSKLLAASSLAGIYVWNTETGKLVHSIRDFGGARELSFSPDGRLLAAADIEGVWEQSEFSGGFKAGQVNVWKCESWELLHQLPVIRGNALSVLFSPDSKILAAGCGDDKVRLWNAETGNLIYTLSNSSSGIERLHSIAFSPDGATLAGVEESSSLVSLWSTKTGKFIKSLNQNAKTNEINESPKRLAFSCDGKMLVVANSDLSIHFLDVKTGQSANSKLARQKINGIALAFSPDHKLLATSIRGGIRLRQTDTGRLLPIIEGGPYFKFSTNGKLLAVTRKNSIQIFPFEQNEQ